MATTRTKKTPTPVTSRTIDGVPFPILFADYEKGSQSLTYTQVSKLGKRRVRVRIKRDSYDAQSYAVAELHDGAQWHELCHLPGDQLSSRRASYADPRWQSHRMEFERDAERLCSRVLLILSE